MKIFIISLTSFALALLPLDTAWAYSHANRWGGSTSHSYGSSSHSSAYGTSTGFGCFWSVMSHESVQ
jgi:hypothetical protein